MTRDDIIRMAREAGGSREDPSDLLTLDILERFAELAVAEEREACAKVCEAYAERDRRFGLDSSAIDCAEAIRARNEEV